MGGELDSKVEPIGGYLQRIVDGELDELLTGLPAVSIEGPKAVGKTATALRRAATVHRLDDPDERSVLSAEMSRLVDGERPILIDEWQRLPASFDRVRRAVDDGAGPASFLLTGSGHSDRPADALGCRQDRAGAPAPDDARRARRCIAFREPRGPF